MTVVGIDVGGTKIAAAIVEPSTGRLREKRVVPTEPDRGGPRVLETCVGLAKLLAQGGRLDGIGIGICEIVDPGGVLTSGVTVDLVGVPVAEAFAHLGPAVLESDIRAAARAEAVFGAGRGRDTFLYVSIGSGIGACFVQDGTPMVGRHGRAQIVGLGSSPTEDLASGPALAAACGLPDAEAVLRAAGAGSSPALGVVQRAASELGATLGSFGNLLDPDAIVIGGGLGLAGGVYWETLVPAIENAIWPAGTTDVPAIVKAELGEDAGIVGAALAGSP